MVFNRRKAAWGVLALAAAAAAFYFVCFDPARTPWAPQCWWYRWTGWRCPGCGTQRALYHLMHLHLGQAFRLNPFLFVALPYLGVLAWLEYFGGKAKHPKAYRLLFGRCALAAALILILCYWVGRNVAGF